MENANSYEYLEKIKIAVIENLKRTAAVPSVQMQDVPRQGLGMTDEEEAELDDLDADENKDVRMTQRQWEKSTVRPEDALYESDDEDMAQANGVYKTKTKRSILDHPNPHADLDTDSGVATPVRNGNGAPVDSIEAADDTMIDDIATEVQDVSKPNSPPKANGDGDVDMVDATEPVVEATVKNEETDAQTSLPADEGKTPAADAAAPPASAAVEVAAATSEPSNADKAKSDTAAVDADAMETDEPETNTVNAEGAGADAAKSPPKA